MKPYLINSRGIYVPVLGAAGIPIGPGSSTDNAVVRFNGTTGKSLQNSLAILDDSGILSTPGLSTLGLTLRDTEHSTVNLLSILASRSGGVVISGIADPDLAVDGVDIRITAGTPAPNGSANGGDLIFTPGSAAQDGGSGQPGVITFNGGLDSDGNPTASIVNIGTINAFGIAIGAGGATISGSTICHGNVAIDSGTLSCIQGTRSERFGSSASANGTDTIAAGNLCIADVNTGVALGATATVTGDSGTAIGFNAIAILNSVALGRGAQVSSNGTMAIGYGSLCSAIRATAIGQASSAAADSALAFGIQTSAGHQASICIGYQATSTAANQLILGGVSSRSIKNVFIGSGVTDSTPDPTVTVQPTGGLGTNVVASDLNIAAGRSTGSAAPAKIAFLIGTVLGSGATAQTLSERARVDTTGLVLTTSDLTMATAGKGISIKEGSNARMGVATLSGGTVVVSNTSVTANSRILLTIQSAGGTLGSVYVSARTAGTSFTISSTSAIDTSIVAWMIVEPA